MPLGECIMLHIGQAGVQVGHACWELFCLEHGIYPNGRMMCDSMGGTDSFSYNMFFNEKMDGSYVPRALLFDLDCTTIDEVRTGTYRHLFSPDLMISGKEDAANNFARGFHAVGREFIPVTMERTRKLVEQCDQLQGFVFIRALGGGCGSGFTAYLIQRLYSFYGKKTKISLDVFPSPNISTAVVEPYNAILSSHSTMDKIDVTFIYNNESMYNILSTRLDCYRPTYTNVNRVIAQIFSGMTAPMRFDGNVSTNIREFQVNLVPYPRVHFPMLSFAPLCSAEKAYHERNTINSMVSSIFDVNNQLVYCNPRYGRYIAASLLFRGDVTPIDVNGALSGLNKSARDGKISFVDWSPTGFKVGMCLREPTFVPGGDLAATSRSVVGMLNTTAIREPWRQLLRKFNMMYKKNAFLHWYEGEGLDLDEFKDARNNMMSLLEEYKEINKREIHEPSENLKGGGGSSKKKNGDMTIYGKNINGVKFS